MRSPIPHRIAPLSWRKPAALWTPLALALAVGWPAALFVGNAGLQRMALVVGAGVFALALVTLGASWAVGRPPKARRDVVLHVLAAGAIAALAAPFVLARLLAAVADYKHQGDGAEFGFAMSLAMTPLAVLLGLPIALISGVAFAWLALAQARVGDGDLMDFRNDVQPFR